MLAYSRAHEIIRHRRSATQRTIGGRVSISSAYCRRRSEVEAFQSDGPHKRQRLVQRLLDDVAYAEHWLTFWNDLLRNDY